ncbi:hypothetical protein [Aurantiacibacter aquimixticola]|uniref:SH3 domain-containing protein n=1 Tax=Aurantiacibacter aquimixticola TaxID=1958945 RepID=A0A419RUC3_9SPHN|nr:hypothetical protein [Aurantiacibacter aquimixticola]RJY09391.1 hypothetical protein D6201_08515 [Aurantiacibacter aquimixticola]
MKFFIPCIGLIATTFIPLSATAQDDPYASCVTITDDTERLACFDATYARQRVVVAEREAREEEQREEVFGFRGEDRAIEQQESEATLTATVSEVLQGQRRSQVLLLDNGQLWREISGSTLRNRVRDGWVATVTQHWSGAYEMRFEGRSGYLRVARLR